MAEARSRRELPPRPRTRLKTDSDDGVDRPDDDLPAPLDDQDRDLLPEEPITAVEAAPEEAPRPAPAPPPAPAPVAAPARPRATTDEEDFAGFDAEINNRYEE